MLTVEIHPIRQEWQASIMLEHELKHSQSKQGTSEEHTDQQDWEEAGEEEVPTVVLYVVAGLLLISFSLYLAIGGGHNHFH